MKRFFILVAFIVIFLLSFTLVACNSYASDSAFPNREPSYEGKNDLDGTYANDSGIVGENERKIIYTAYSTLTVEKVDEALSKLRAMLVSGEWIEKSQTAENYAQIVLRVKSERLNAFLDSLSEVGQVEGTQVSSDDISLSYYDTTLKKQTLENEYKRLNELLNSADNISDILTINKRLAEIESELQRLQNKLNSYDSLIEYSSLTISIYKKGEAPKKATFGDKVSSAYSVSGIIAEGFGIFLITILPYLAGGAVLAVAIVFITKAAKKKKQEKISASSAVNEGKEIVSTNGDNVTDKK